MDIDLLSKMVKELILDNDRVVLPGLGAFVAEIVPSTFSDKGYTINPPYRRLYFRSKPDEGNELVEFYAAGNNIDVDVAERIMRDFIHELKGILHVKKTIVFPGLGRLRATKENNVFFVADEDLDIYPAGFGLEPVSLKTHQETQEEVTAAVENLKSLLVEPEQIVETIPEVIPEPQPETVPEPDPIPEQILEPEPIPEPIPEPESEVEVEPEIEVEEVVKNQPQLKPSGNLMKTVAITVLTIAAVCLVALAVAGRVWPEFVDTYLYSSEELRILNHKL